METPLIAVKNLRKVFGNVVAVDDVIGTALGTGPTNDLTGYTEYSLFVANDNNSDWLLKLWIRVRAGCRLEKNSCRLHVKLGTPR